MTLEFIDLSKDASESDVEQHIIMPLITTPLPYGLGISKINIHTKANIKTFKIDKGKTEKLYYPDYLIVDRSIPLLLIEAKKPSEDLKEAFREARLYATELNSSHPSGINPLKKIIATNGFRFISGYFDQSNPILDFELKDLGQYSETLQNLQNFCSGEVLRQDYHKLKLILKNKRFYKPRRMLGSISIQHEEVGHNTFGATVANEVAHIFNPSTIEDRKNIAVNGYIPSRRRERYTDPIDRVIRAAKAPSDIDAQRIEDTSSPKEVLNVFKRVKELQHQVILLVGSVGVGKSTFIDRLQYVALPHETRDSTLWIRVDMNTAPISPNEIYNWLRNKIIHQCRYNYQNLDFDEIATTKLLYSVEINKFNKGKGSLLSDDKYNDKLFELLSDLEKDLDATVVAHLRYCATERGLLPIIVLDNCDKRNREEQLLLFEVAQWVRQQYRCLVILPLREETYDNYRDQPPLDTAQKDLVFRIEPPLFQNVIVSRIQLALNKISQNGEKTARFSLPNGFHVDYPASDKAYFLKSILNAIFHYDRHIRRMIIGLSGRSIRRALEIFSEFCTSGHFGDDHIFKIKQTKGEYVPPLHVIMRVLLRGNRRFYDTDHAYVKNIFAINDQDDHPHYFVRLMILRWLKERFHEKGPTAFKGYFPIQILANEFEKYGIKEEVTLREVEYLTKGSCIISEDFRDSGLTFSHNVKLAPAGFVHLELLSSVDVIAAYAEDTWFGSSDAAQGIRDRIITIDDHFSPATTISNASDLLSTLKLQQKSENENIEAVFKETDFAALTDLRPMQIAIESLEKSFTPVEWIDIKTRYPHGSRHKPKVVNVTSYGIFVEFEHKIRGLLHISEIDGDIMMENVSIGDIIDVCIKNVDPIKRRIALSLPQKIIIN